MFTDVAHASPSPAAGPIPVLRSPFRLPTLEMYRRQSEIAAGKEKSPRPRRTATPEAPLWSLADVLDRLGGRVGRTFLLQHIRRIPVYGGGPTHLRAGRKLLWRPADSTGFLKALPHHAPSRHAQSRHPLPHENALRAWNRQRSVRL